MQSGYLVDHLIIIFWATAISVYSNVTYNTNIFLKQCDCNVLNFNTSARKSESFEFSSMCIIYIYIYRERERETDRQRETERETDRH